MRRFVLLVTATAVGAALGIGAVVSVGDLIGEPVSSTAAPQSVLEYGYR